MLFDILAVFVVTLISTLLLCTTSVHGLPKLPSTHHQLTQKNPSADLSSPLRPLHQPPIPHVDYDLGGDTSEMLSGESNEYSRMKNLNDDLSSSSSLSSSIHASDVPFDFYLQQLPSKLSSRKFFSSLQKHQQHQEEKQQKRASSPSISAPPSLPIDFNLDPAAVAAAAFADPSDPSSVVNLSRLSESTRLSPSLKVLVETNPIARAWLTMLLQKVMEEQPTPYIFKYGRRRKK
ncbi:unnamed protein product [Adineta ricciae]|uniref:Uncharacterized protein n=1 Tax=Adineta ricciae TaxID=249248 RepID=A0A813RX43_ADIRI|nr:unnamed protein product [Adineta ricciae]